LPEAYLRKAGFQKREQDPVSEGTEENKENEGISTHDRSSWMLTTASEYCGFR
jgi:hypothetical protein